MTESDIVRRTLPEQMVEGHRLGRHVVHDPRSRNFSADAAAAIKSVQHPAPDNATGRQFGENDAVSLYELETQLEGQPYPPNDPGGSGLMVSKAAKQLGWISSYTHAFGIDHALRALTLRPVITGVNWYTSFDAPDANGLVAIASNATVRGGHEVVADAIDEPNRLVWFWNSWGASYGLGGRFCMSFDTWAQLLAEQGDVTVPMV